MFIVSCPVEFFSPSGATSDVPRCRSLRSLAGLFLRNYKHFAPLGLRPQNPLVPETFKSFAQRRKERERRVSTRRSRPGCRAISALLRHFVAAPDQCAEHTFLVSVED